MFKFNVLVFFVLVSSRYINGQVENLIGLPVEYNADDDLDSQINNDIWSNDDHLNLEDDYPAKLLLTLCKKYYLELNNELVDCESINLIPKSLRHTLNKREASEDNLEEGSGAEPPVEPENPEESQAVVETAVEEESKTPEQSPAKEETKPAEETAAEEESKPAEATEEESKPAEAAEEESKPAEATEEESKPAEVAEEESKPTEAAEEESKRAEATEEESKPIEAAEEELKPAEATEEESKPAEAAEEESKPTEAAEEESKTPEETAITEETPSELEVVPSEGPVQPLEENKETPAETKESEGKEETGGPAFKQQSLVIPDIVESDKLKEEPSQTPDENLETPTDSNPTETKEKENPGSDTIEIGKEKGQEEAKKDETQNKEEVQINQSGITAVKDGGSMSETENKLNSMKPNEKLKTIATAGEEPKSGASESDDLGRKDNKLLIILFVAVLAIGAAAFTYNFIRKRKRNATAARTPAQNGTPVADPEQGREMKPLMKSPEQSNSVEYKDEK